MELVLTQQEDYQVNVICDHHSSHTFDLQPLRLLGHWFERIKDNPIRYGQLLFQALFPHDSLARHVLDGHPERIVLVNTDNELDTLPWEYLYGPEGFLVLDIPFVRSLPAKQRMPAPTLDMPLHIVAVPSNPLSDLVEPLNIDAEWSHLTEIINSLPFSITLERVRPPTLQQVHNLLANTCQRVLHFMGHGEQMKDGAYLSFEKDNGDLDLVETEQLIAQIHGTPFLITLNACASASPGHTAFSNLAASLVNAKVPYALGMRFRIYDDDALVFSRMFYTELAQGTSVEDALLQTRRSLAKSPRTWTVGVPVLYTSLKTPTGGFVQHAGAARIAEHQPRIEANGVARVIGTFQGRTDDLKRLGNLLTGDHRPHILTIHGGGGQGKTALAREAIERFAYAWPRGIWGIILDPLPDRSGFVSQLAQFLGINVQETTNLKDLECQVIQHLAARRSLLVLDNAETLIDAIEANDAQASLLAEFIQQLPNTSVSLLITSRIQLTWPGEITHELGGLTPKEGAHIFRQYAPQRQEAIYMKEAQQLSQKIEGHPLGLRLLAGAFNTSTLTLKEFIQQYEEQLIQAENTYVGEEHRHRKLYASIETSIRYLNDDLRNLLSNLWIFQAPFLPEIAHSIFDPDTEEIHSPIRTQLHTLWQCGLLSHITITARDGTQNLYYLLPTTRPYIQALHSTSLQEEIFRRYGEAYETFTRMAYDEFDRSASITAIAQHMEKDLEQGIRYVEISRQDAYKTYWAKILFHLGKSHEAQVILEEVLEQIQGSDQQLEFVVLNSLGLVYSAIGQRQRALALHEQALSITREVGGRSDEAITLHNMGLLYQNIGQPQRALALYEQALPIAREVSDRAGEAAIFNGMGVLYQQTGQPQRALPLYEQALSIRQEVGDRSGEVITLHDMGLLYRETGQPQRALALYEQALPIAREVSDRAGEAGIFNGMGVLYQQTGQPQHALALYEQALPILCEVGDRSGEAITLSNMGLLYQETDQLEHALALCEQALPIFREVGDRDGEVITLNNMGLLYKKTGQPQRALTLYEQALPITCEIGHRYTEATTLHNMALVYQDTDQLQRALALYEQALLIFREVGDRSGEATTLMSMGLLYQNNSQLQGALPLIEQALLIFREIGNRAGEAHTLSRMGLLYQRTGQPQRALALYEQALPILREIGNRSGEANIFHNMAGIYQDTDQSQRALALYEQALPILREIGNRPGEANTLSSMGLLYQETDQSQRALALYEQALPILCEVGDRLGEATTLMSMGTLYQVTDQPQRALALFVQALPIFREVGNRSGEATTLVYMGLLYRITDQPQSALPCYEQALPITREIGNRTAEAATLADMGILYQDTGQPQSALPCYEQALPITREVGNRTSEATILFCMGSLFYKTFNDPHKSLQYIQQVRYLLEHYDITQNEVNFTLEEICKIEKTIQKTLSQSRRTEKASQPTRAKRMQSLWKILRWS